MLIGYSAVSQDAVALWNWVMQASDEELGKQRERSPYNVVHDTYVLVYLYNHFEDRKAADYQVEYALKKAEGVIDRQWSGMAQRYNKFLCQIPLQIIKDLMNSYIMQGKSGANLYFLKNEFGNFEISKKAPLKGGGNHKDEKVLQGKEGNMLRRAQTGIVKERIQSNQYGFSFCGKYVRVEKTHFDLLLPHFSGNIFRLLQHLVEPGHWEQREVMWSNEDDNTLMNFYHREESKEMEEMYERKGKSETLERIRYLKWIGKL